MCEDLVVAPLHVESDEQKGRMLVNMAVVLRVSGAHSMRDQLNRESKFQSVRTVPPRDIDVEGNERA